MYILGFIGYPNLENMRLADDYQVHEQFKFIKKCIREKVKN